MSEDKRNRNCIFCDAVSRTDDRETLVVYRGESVFVILNRYPYTSGHLMIAPYEHVSRLNQTNESTTREMMTLARQAERALEDV
ncbi:MAG: HIT domain-containing protein, partial [Acidobacteriaceae bacterium]|nr:HIT domain-containing protein [Acidobacteriaceae bacterium]